MPTIITLGSASAKALGFALSTEYFISGITFNEGISTYAIDFAAYALEVDASGNTTVFGYRGRSSTDAYVARLVFNPTGGLTTKQAIYSSSPTGPNGPVLGSVTDSVGNVYTSNYYLGGAANALPIITKYTSAGTVVATSTTNYGPVSPYGSRGGNLFIDSSGNIFQLLLGSPSSIIGKYVNGLLIKYNSSLDIINSGVAYQFTGTTSVSIEFAAIDSTTPTNQIILGGSTATFTSPNYSNTSFIQKVNSSTFSTIGGINSQSTTTTSAFNGAVFLSAAVDASNNVYSLQFNTLTSTMTLYKYTALGSGYTQSWGYQWNELMGSNIYASAIKFDGTGNLYFTYLTTRSVLSDSGTKYVTDTIIAKFSTTRSFRLFRRLYCTNTSQSYNQLGTNVTVSSQSNVQNYTPSSTPSLKVQGNNLYISGVVDYYNSSGLSIPYMFLFKVPNSLALTQSFTVGIYNMVYATYSPSVTSSTSAISFSSHDPVGSSIVGSSKTPNLVTITPTTLQKSL